MIIDAKKYSGQCSCGKNHKMITEAAIIEAGCLKKFDFYKGNYFPNAKVFTAVYDENTYAATANCRPNTQFSVVLPPEDLHANEKACELLLSQMPDETEVLVAVGAGTVHDITRYCAHKKNIPFIACPTAASVDGFCSSVAAMTWQGYKKTFPAVAPQLVLADLDVISRAPMRLTRAGFGDMIGKFISLADWKIASAITGEYLCEEIFNLTMLATQAVLDSVDGLIVGNEAAYEQLTYGLLMSGLAMQMIGNSRPASAAEHHVSHLIEMKPDGLKSSSDALHGEKVGVATLLVAKEYQDLVRGKINWQDYKFMDEQSIRTFFGEQLAPSILEENGQNYGAELTKETLAKAEEQIRAIVETIPKESDLLEKYERIGAKKTLSEIDVDEAEKEALFTYSPLVRRRLTFMRLRNTIKKA